MKKYTGRLTKSILDNMKARIMQETYTKAYNKLSHDVLIKRYLELRNIEKNIKNLFEHDLKKFVGKSINVFFELFPEMEKYYVSPEKPATLPKDRNLVPVSYVEKVNSSIKTILNQVGE